MKRKTAAEILRDADRELNVIPGRVRPHRSGKRAIKLEEVSHVEMPVYTPHRMTEEDWVKAGGLKCPRCNNDVVRLVPIGLTGKHKICTDCLERRRRLIAFKNRLLDNRRNAALVKKK